MINRKTIIVILAASFLIMLVFLIKNAFYNSALPDDSSDGAPTVAMPAAAGTGGVNSDAAIEAHARRAIAKNARADSKSDVSKATDDENQLQTSLYFTYRSLWNPFGKELFSRPIETLQITKEEAVVIQNAFIELQNKYDEYMASKSQLIEETETEAKFMIASFANEAQGAHQEFLDKIKPHVSAGTYAIMADGMPVFSQALGLLGGDQQDLTITKASDNAKFDTNLKTKDTHGRETAFGWRSISKDSVITLYGRIIEVNNSNILK